MCGIKRLMLFESKQSSISTTNIYLTKKLVLVLNYLFGRKLRPQKNGQMQVLSLWKKYNVHVGSFGSFVKLKINKLGFTQSVYFPQLIASWANSFVAPHNTMDDKTHTLMSSPLYQFGDIMTAFCKTLPLNCHKVPKTSSSILGGKLVGFMTFTSYAALDR